MALPGRQGNRRRALFPRLLRGLRDETNRAGAAGINAGQKRFVHTLEG
jgi:hypothetical protein